MNTLLQAVVIVFLSACASGNGWPQANTPAPEKALKQFVDAEQDRLCRAIKLGVPVVSGSDMYLTIPGKDRGQASLLVFEGYAEAGMAPMQIMRAATHGGAELLGLQYRIGALKSGKLADIIAVPGDPTKDLKPWSAPSW